MSSSAGRTFGGRYNVIAPIGYGGMADVYRARDSVLERDVALKVLNPRFVRDPYFVDRFRKEAAAAARLHHPNIVAFYDYGTEEDHYFIAMELIEGRTLEEIVLGEGPLEPRRCARIAAEVAAALEAAHDSGLIHRDISPSNVLITTGGAVKVADFGIATALREDERTTEGRRPFVGTAAYLSPEQAQGNAVDERTDLYSLGVVLYEMLTGAPPFTGDSPVAVASQHVLAQPPVHSSINSAVPHALDAITLRALAKHADRRFGSAALMRTELENVVAGKSVRSTLVLDHAPLAGRRRGPSALALATMVLIALSMLAGGWLVLDQRARDQRSLPALEHRLVADDERRLEQFDVLLRIERSFSDEPRGFVLSQRPRSGVEVLPGDTVHLVVSSGPEPHLAGHLTSSVLDIVDEATRSIDLSVEAIDSVLDR
jgi:serine/threonine protein kinase